MVTVIQRILNNQYKCQEHRLQWKLNHADTQQNEREDRESKPRKEKKVK